MISTECRMSSSNMPLHRTHDGVNVVRHDDVVTHKYRSPSKCRIASSTICGNFRAAQHALAHPDVEPALKFLCESFVILRFLFGAVRLWIFLQPVGHFPLPLPELCLRYRIRQPERDKVSRAILPPIRKMPSINCQPARHGLNGVKIRTGVPSAPANEVGVGFFSLLALARSLARRDACPTFWPSVALVITMLVSLSNKRRRK